MDGKFDNIFILCEIQYTVIIFIMDSQLPTLCKYFGTVFILCVFSFTVKFYIYLSLSELCTVKETSCPHPLKSYKIICK